MTHRTLRIDNTVVKACGVAKCSACHTLKPTAEFYADRSRSTGISSRCKACDRVRLQSLPERSLTRDLQALMQRHPKHRELLKNTVASIAA